MAPDECGKARMTFPFFRRPEQAQKDTVATKDVLDWIEALIHEQTAQILRSRRAFGQEGISTCKAAVSFDKQRKVGTSGRNVHVPHFAHSFRAF